MSRAAREIHDKKLALDQYKELFRVLVRVFYTDLHVVIMDYIVKSYFEKQFFLTSEVARDTKISEKAVRAELQEFKKAKLVNSISEDQLANPEFEFIQKKIDELGLDTVDRTIYGNASKREEIWELNRKVKDLVEDKLKIIEKKMNEEFEVTPFPSSHSSFPQNPKFPNRATTPSSKSALPNTAKRSGNPRTTTSPTGYAQPVNQIYETCTTTART
jgi:hypothetical protein